MTNIWALGGDASMSARLLGGRGMLHVDSEVLGCTVVAVAPVVFASASSSE